MLLGLRYRYVIFLKLLAKEAAKNLSLTRAFLPDAQALLVRSVHIEEKPEST
jgi:hypothetical protein